MESLMGQEELPSLHADHANSYAWLFTAEHVVQPLVQQRVLLETTGVEDRSTAQQGRHGLEGVEGQGGGWLRGSGGWGRGRGRAGDGSERGRRRLGARLSVDPLMPLHMYQPLLLFLAQCRRKQTTPVGKQVKQAVPHVGGEEAESSLALRKAVDGVGYERCKICP